MSVREPMKRGLHVRAVASCAALVIASACGGAGASVSSEVVTGHSMVYPGLPELPRGPGMAWKRARGAQHRNPGSSQAGSRHAASPRAGPALVEYSGSEVVRAQLGWAGHNVQGREVPSMPGASPLTEFERGVVRYFRSDLVSVFCDEWGVVAYFIPHRLGPHLGGAFFSRDGELLWAVMPMRAYRVEGAYLTVIPLPPMLGALAHPARWLLRGAVRGARLAVYTGKLPVRIAGGIAARARYLVQSVRARGAHAGPSSAARTVVQAYRPFTAANFRHNLVVLTGGAPRGAQAHHVLPQKYASEFANRGINVHDPRYGAWWRGGLHQRAASAYNQQWRRFFDRRPPPTPKEALAFCREIAKEHGLKIYF